MKYIILTTEQLDNILPIELKQYKYYDNDYKLSEVIYGLPIELEDGSWLCNACLRDKEYVNNNCVENEPTDMEYELFNKHVAIVIDDTSNLKYKVYE